MDGPKIALLVGAGVLALLIFSFIPKSDVPNKVHTPPDSGEGKRVLVTGASGFIGSHTVQACVELGMTVVGVDDMSGGFYENILPHKRNTFIKADIKDAEAMAKIFKEHGPFDYVYHLAAYAAEGLSHFIPSYNYRNNFLGSIELLSLAIKTKVKVFVFTSSIAVYGSVTGEMKESVEPKPEDPYGIAKYAMEMHLRTAHEIHGMKYIIFRPHNVYGPHQNIADKYRNVVGIFMNQLIHKKPLTIFGDGQQTRSFSYVDDVAPVIAKSPLFGAAHNEIFNVGADKPYKLTDLAKAVAISMGQPKAEIVYLDARQEVVLSSVKNNKVREYFGLQEPTELADGLNRTVAWVHKVGHTYLPVQFESVEIIAHMPPSWVRKDLGEKVTIRHTSEDNPRAVDYEKKHSELRK